MPRKSWEHVTPTISTHGSYFLASLSNVFLFSCFSVEHMAFSSLSSKKFHPKVHHLGISLQLLLSEHGHSQASRSLITNKCLKWNHTHLILSQLALSFILYIKPIIMHFDPAKPNSKESQKVWSQLLVITGKKNLDYWHLMTRSSLNCNGDIKGGQAYIHGWFL